MQQMEQNRGIIIYVKQDLNCKQVFLNNSFMEYVLLEIQTDLNKVMQVATIYRSPNSSFENSLNMCSLIDHICSRSVISTSLTLIGIYGTQ